MRPERLGLWALLLVTMVWGTTFPAMKLLSGQLDALQIIWLRFAIALLVLGPLWLDMQRNERRWGALLGTLLFLAFWLQIEGLARTSSNRNAFVTGLNVLVVPLIAMAALGLSTHISSVRAAGTKPLVLAAILFVWLLGAGLLLNIWLPSLF